MIIQLKSTHNYRSFLDTRTADVIMQVGTLGFYAYCLDGYYEAIVRGTTPSNRNIVVDGEVIVAYPAVDAPHIAHKRQVVQFMRGYTEDEVEMLSEADLDGILYDFAQADIRNADLR